MKSQWLVLVIVGVIAISTNDLNIADSWGASKVIQFILCISGGFITAFIIERVNKEKS